jgi:hypothetical protein
MEDELWQWVDLSLAFVEEEMQKRERKEKLFTVFAFLTFMKRTKRVIFQDAAYMMEFHPERAHHPLFWLSYQCSKWIASKSLERKCVIMCHQ